MADLDPVETERAKVTRGRALDKLRNDEYRDNLHRVIEQPWGRAFVWQLLERASVFEPLNVRSDTLPALVAVQNEGKVLLKECLTADPNFYNIAQFEAIERGKRLGK